MSGGGREKKQIPGGNDRKKGNGKGPGRKPILGEIIQGG